MPDMTTVLVVVIIALVATLAVMGIGSVYSILQANKKVVEMAFQSLPPAVLTMLQQAFGDLHKLTELLQDLLEPDEDDENGGGTGADTPPAHG